ncbi:neurobeachin-like protein 1 [Ornithodoros turicata]|uniref:neurobeachin-like protein 1 n=1 Tax=Ornithodoros turicata TaxID=34597 RepID=UPI00313A338F
MTEKETLEALWSAFQSKKSASALVRYMTEFRRRYAACITPAGLQDERTKKNVPHLIDLPEGFLLSIEDHLQECEGPFSGTSLQEAHLMVQVLAILACNQSNLPFVAASSAVPLGMAISSAVVNQCVQQQQDAEEGAAQFLLTVLQFLELLYDPCRVWQNTWAGDLQGAAISKLMQRCQASNLHLEVMPFLYDCLHSKPYMLPESVQLKLVHLFGAIMSGAQHNAQVALSEDTVSMLLISCLRGSTQGDGTHVVPPTVRAAAGRCLLRAISALTALPVHQRKVSPDNLVSHMLGVLSELMGEEEKPNQVDTVIGLLACLRELVSRDAALGKILHDNELVKCLLRSLHGTKLIGISAQRVAASTVRLLHIFLRSYPTAEKPFAGMLGYRMLLGTLQRLGDPHQDTMESLLEWVVERIPRDDSDSALRNITLAVQLVRWVPTLESPEKQFLLANEVATLAEKGSRARHTACRGGLVLATIAPLSHIGDRQLYGKAAGRLLRFLVNLGSCSVTPQELKALFALLHDGQEQNPYVLPVTYALTCMVKGDVWPRVSHFFDFCGSKEGIEIPSIKKWPGYGFSFHAWVRFDEYAWKKERNSHRRQLYRFHLTAGSVLEAFLTARGELVVAVTNKKEHFAILGDRIDDEAWHCLDICHSPARHPFGSGNLSVFVDSKRRASVQLKLPSFTEFCRCHVGLGNRGDQSPCAGGDSTANGDNTATPSGKETRGSGRALGQLLTWGGAERLLSFAPSAAVQLRGSSAPDPAVIATPTQEVQQVWGCPEAMGGQVATLCIFSESLNPGQVKKLYNEGPNSSTLFQDESDLELADLTSKLVVFYDAKASTEEACTNLAPSGQYDGHVQGRIWHSLNAKDSLSVIGGFPVLYPLLENAWKSVTPSLLADLESSLLLKSSMPDTPSNGVAAGNFSSPATDWKLAQNQVATVLMVIQYLMQGCPENQLRLLLRSGLPTLGVLLQKAPSQCIDVNVLMAAQLLVERAALTDHSADLLEAVCKHILFDFRIWSRGSFAVRIGHIQYISTIIKEDRKYYRKKYGPQFLLDATQMFYSACGGSEEEDMKMIRKSVLSLVKFYMSRDVNVQDITALVSYILSQKKEELICEALELLLQLLESPTSRDQLVLLLYEPNCAELFYCLLLNQDLSNEAKVTVIKLLCALLKSEKVYEKSKVRLRLWDVGFAALTSLLPPPGDTSTQVLKELVDLVLTTDTMQSLDAFLSLLSFMRLADVEAKLYAIQRLLKVLDSQPVAVVRLAQLTGWQECLLGLLVQRPMTERVPPQEPFTSNSHSPSGSAGDTGSGQSPEAGDAMPLRRRLSRRALVAQQSLEDLLRPSSPRASMLLSQLRDHVMDSEIAHLLTSGRSRSSSYSSSREDIANMGESPQSLRCSSALALSSGQQSNGTVENLKGEPSGGTKELLDCVVEATFRLSWRGIEGSSRQAWLERGQLLVCINKLALCNELFFSHLEIKRQLFEKLLEACCADIQDAAQVNATLTENASELVKVFFDFVCSENTDDDRRLSVKLLENVLGLMDTLLVFAESPVDEGWEEMAQMALSIILVCATSKKIELCAMATAKLHALVQTRPQATVAETCYLLTCLNSALTTALQDGEQEYYSFALPVVRALLDRLSGPLQLYRRLPDLPETSVGPTFFEAFKQYVLKPEWSTFVADVVVPLQERYALAQRKERHEAMNDFWNMCYEALMVSMHRRGREAGESKLRFQSQVLGAFQARLAEEQLRLLSVQTGIRSQQLLLCRHWDALKLFLVGPRGPWAASTQKPLYWKLSQQENFSRMRLKLTLNPHFDSHYEASSLRDNQGYYTSQQQPMGHPPPVAAQVALHREDSVPEEDLPGPPPTGQGQRPESPVGDGLKPVVDEECDLVTLMKVVRGRFQATATMMRFSDLSPTREGVRQDFCYPLSVLREVHLRRYNLRRSALEFFLVDQTNFFLNFTTKTRNKIFGKLVSLHPPNLLYSSTTRSPADVLKASGLTQRWVQREISNFDYLMHLNTIAGRTYNDLSQYPVFPWVLADYSSEELDLDNPSTYRDLSRPIGVVNPKNEAEVRAKYENFVDLTGAVEKFHYGTHYSNSAGVLHYLVRLEPFTSLHIELQSGRFDVADRQFHSVEATWKMLMESPSDVKELIPEFFYLPEFLVNMNGFDLGRLQSTREPVGNVCLPQWASSPEDFIFKHRKALESECVSLHLHEWIDLIFGHKQKGPAAVEALNVFYYVSYEGVVDLDSIKDPIQRAATEGIINNFGQTPCQLLKEPHPRRMSLEASLTGRPDSKPPSLFLCLPNFKAYVIEAPLGCPVAYVCIPRCPTARSSFVQPHGGTTETLITVGQDGSLGLHGWLPYDRTRAYPNYFTFDKDPMLASPKTARKLSGPFDPSLKVHGRLFAVSADAKFLVSGGHWDSSVRAYSLVKGKQVARIILHKDVVTCLALDTCGMFLMTGSKDTTCILWELNQQSAQGNFLPEKPFQILCGHDSEVACVAVLTELDMAISGSKDGTVNVHSIRDGHFLHTLQLPCTMGQPHAAVALLAVSHLGYICVHSRPQNTSTTTKGGHVLHLFTINGKYLMQKEVSSEVSDMLASGDFLISGHRDGSLTVWELFGMNPRTTLSLGSPVASLALSPAQSHIICSLRDGKLIVVGVAPPSR